MVFVVSAPVNEILGLHRLEPLFALRSLQLVSSIHCSNGKIFFEQEATKETEQAILGDLRFRLSNLVFHWFAPGKIRRVIPWLLSYRGS